MAKKHATIRDVAREAGVSVATVSRLINSNGYISQETENKVRKVMERLKYQPNEIARGLAMQKSRTIALMVPDISNPFFPELVVAIEQVAKSKGYSIILMNTQEGEIQNSNFWSQLQNRYTDGLILASFSLNDSVHERIEALGIPYIQIDRAATYNTNNSIGVDNFKGAQLAVEHLLEVGCRRIAHISGPESLPLSQERTKGFINALNKHIPDITPIVYEGDFTLESGKLITKQLLKEHPAIDGIFLANDLMAIGSLKALKSLNIKVPEDIAIIGFDGIKLTEMVEPEISTVEQPIYNIGVIATNKLISKIENTIITVENGELDVRLVRRDSTLGFRRKGIPNLIG